jgi:O-antigen biosynthesis protein
MGNVYNILISFFTRIKYSISEPIKLKIARTRHEHKYRNLSQNSSPLISITIPTYDRGKLLIERTLPAIFAQTYSNFEVIIVGDCCEEPTRSILSTLDDPRVKFINLKKRTKYPNDPKLRWFISGVAPSNHGIDLAQGEWICYFDDDDIMAPNYLESLIDFARNGNYEFVAGLYEEERNGVNSVQGQKSSQYPEFGGHSTWLYRSYLSFFKYNINSWRKSYNCPQDIDMQLRMKDAGVRMELLEKVVSYIKPRPGNTTIGLDARMEDSFD